MEDFSEQSIRENCPDCDPNSFALKNPLKETNNFWVVDISLAAPRFFGDRFADAFGTPEKEIGRK